MPFFRKYNVNDINSGPKVIFKFSQNKHKKLLAALPLDFSYVKASRYCL